MTLVVSAPSISFRQLIVSGVHVVIQMPPLPSRDVVGLNRPQEDEADQAMKYIHDTPYGQLAPSDAAKASEFRRLQNDEKQRILNDRPHKDIQITPIALLYPPFGEFLDHIRNPPMISDGVHLQKLEAAVDDFSFLMCQHYTDEEGRRKKVLKALNAIFECYLPSQLIRIIPSPIYGYRSSDGHADGPAGVLEVIVEFKNELGIGNTDPEIQITAYYLQSLLDGSSGPHKALYERFLFPALGISLMGKGHEHDFFFEPLVVIAHTLFFFQVRILDSVLSYFSVNADSSDSHRCSRLALLLAMIPPHLCYSMLSGLPVCYAPESAGTLGKRWIIRSSGLNPNAETYLIFTRYQPGRQMPALKS